MLPVFRRFSQQDYPTSPNWLAQVFGPLNIFCEQTIQTLNKNLVVGENVQGQKFTTTVTTSTTYSLGDFQPLVFKYTGGGQPNCCIIGRIVNNDGTVITSPVTVTDWFLNLNTNPYTVSVGYISGLDNNAKYTITLLVI